MPFISVTFNKLFSDHSNKTFDAFSKDAITRLIQLAITYGVLSSGYLAVSTLFKMKNKSAKKISSNDSPSIEPCGKLSLTKIYKFYLP